MGVEDFPEPGETINPDDQLGAENMPESLDPDNMTEEQRKAVEEAVEVEREKERKKGK